ncbi:hypothetical protein CDD81_7912 [Ophiocordyceps australis]|uniref:Uncharacterized protein n=1 Tax=Ophiocordyceps australis TaxID=1399860 RepID=A0A2C5XBN1_9HYPO|nr:hypothetical protein CDD81_7912 [Ophiocordyceps australis]
MSPSATQDVLDRIGTLSAPLRCMSSIAPLVSLLAMAFQARQIQEPKRLANLMHTMSLPLQDNDKVNHDVFVSSFIRLLSPVLNGKAGLEDVETALGALQQPVIFRTFWTLDGENLIKQAVDGDAHAGSLESVKAPFLDVFVHDASRRIGLTCNKGCLVLVPGHAQCGDELWEAEGDSHLLVRRAGEGGMHQTIGEAFFTQT